jgi:hypothetical protein
MNADLTLRPERKRKLSMNADLTLRPERKRKLDER